MNKQTLFTTPKITSSILIVIAVLLTIVCWGFVIYSIIAIKDMLWMSVFVFLAPLFFIYIYLLRTYLSVEIVDNKLVFRGVMIKTKKIEVADIAEIKTFFASGGIGMDYNAVQFKLKSKKIISLNKDIENLNNLFDWIKSRNQNIKFSLD